ncbi:MAG TPA: DUF177 domain-containing protein [Flavobacteriales bacterium]
MEPLLEHTIAFAGLKDGHHEFHFVLGDAFFAATGVEDFLGGEVDAEVRLDKSEHLLVTLITVDGHIRMRCDHCDGEMQQPVKGEQRQIFKLTHEEGFEDDDELVGLDPSANEINLTHYFFECISLHLPIRHVHPAGQCDPEVESALSKIQVDHEPETDPRWEALKALKNKS